MQEKKCQVAVLCSTVRTYKYKEKNYDSISFTFLIIAIIAAVLGVTGVVGIAVEIAWTLFMVGLIVSVIFWVIGRRPPKV